MKKEELQLNNQNKTSGTKGSKNERKPYKSPTLTVYGTVSKLTQGTRSKGVEGVRKQV